MRLRILIPIVTLATAVGIVALLQSSRIAAADATPPPHVPGELLVKFKSEAGIAQRSSLRSLYNATVRNTFASGGEYWKLHRSEDLDTVLDDLGRNSSIEYAERNWIMEMYLDPNDPRYVQNQQWALRNAGVKLTSNCPPPASCVAGADIDADQAWNTSRGSSTVVVGIIDTGIHINHPDFSGNIWDNPGEVLNGADDDNNQKIDDLHGWNFVESNNDVTDVHPFQHGTGSASVIGARGNNGAFIAGINWDVKLMALRAAENSITVDKDILAIDYAAAKGARIINHSFGGMPFSLALKDAIKGAHDKEILFVTAAGNRDCDIDNDPDPNCVNNKYPQKFDSKNMIVVAATICQDVKDNNSNWGATSVDLAAPGDSIYRLGYDSSRIPPWVDGGCFGDTSAATPHVAGVAALVLAIKSLIPAESLKALIMQNVDSLPAGSGLEAGLTVTGGRLNARRAVENQDLISPGTITDLTVAPSTTTMNLSWTANGDDENQGTATFYDVRHASTPITGDNFESATRTYNEPVPLVSGTPQSMTATDLLSGVCYYWGMRGYDEWGNGPVSNVIKCGTKPTACTISYCKDALGEVMFRCTNTGRGASTCPQPECCQYNCVPDETCTGPDPVPTGTCGYCP